MRIIRTYVTLAAVFLFILATNTHVQAQTISWDVTINGQDQNGNSLDLVVGTADGATDGFDAGLDQFAPPAAPNGSFDLRIVDGDEDYFKQYRPITTGASNWVISLRPSEGGTQQVTLSWDTAELSGASGFFLMEYDAGSGTESLDMTAVNQLVLTGAEPADVTVIHIVEETVTESFSEGWQQIGYPAEQANVSPFTIFTNAIEGTFFTHAGNYSEETEFSPGVGYWIRLSASETVTVEPPLLNDISLTLDAGWYLISGPGLPVAFTDIQDPSNVLVSGTLQGYNAGYFAADTLKPGRGYWVRSQGTGTITMSSDFQSLTKQVAKSAPEPEGFVAFKVTTNSKESPKFFIGGSLSEPSDINPLSFSMPPLPPSGAFDIRFENNSRLMNGQTGTMIVRSPGDSLAFSHANDADDPLIFSFIREGSDEAEELEVKPGESVEVSSVGISEIDVKLGVTSSVNIDSESPQRIELAQNYPNPFNPTTLISYTLPQSGTVSLEIFDMTGRRIALLADGNKSAGTHTLEFNASQLSSGVYMYRLQSSGTTLTRKMTLVK